MIDRTSRWPEAVPLSSITAESCARAFISTWISRFGVPALLTSDRGAQFTSAVWSEVCSVLGISHIQTTSFHPQSNGMIERFHRSLKCALRARMAGSDWSSHLPLVMLGLRTAPKDDSGFSPAEAVYGTNLSLPGKFIKHTVSSGSFSSEDRALSLRILWSSAASCSSFYFNPCPVNYSRMNSFFSEMMLQNLFYLRSTEVHTEFLKDLKKFVFFKSMTNPTLYP